MNSKISKIESLLWYWRRLKYVPFAEFPYRALHLVKKFWDKTVSQPALPQTCDPDTVKINRIDVSEMLQSDPRQLQIARDMCEQICDHRFVIFGQDAYFGEDIDWALDPKTGKSWPKHFWGDIKYRDGQTIGGIKFAWELNRLHHFPRLAIASVVTGDSKYEREIFDQIRSWLKSNPYPIGINWSSGIELGIRLVNLVYALKILPDAPRGDDHKVVSEFVYRHATHLLRYPSKYSSSANHALAEALGLYVAGVSFPGFAASTRWKQFGKEVLEREVTRQIHPDGSSFEHSFPYLQFVVDHYLIYFLMCEEHGDNCSDAVRERLESALGFISSMLDENGNYAAIGDDDSGYVMKLWFGEHNNFLSILQTGAVLFNDNLSAGGDTAQDLKTQVLLANLNARDRSGEKSSDAAADSDCVYYDNAGLAVVRSQHPVSLLFVGNSGPLGLAPLAGHGHADALSFWLSVSGQPVFVDPGTYLYHSGGFWRNYFRSTAAHNTIRIDSIDQSRMISDFMFDDPYEIIHADLLREGDRAIWTATHNGYLRLADPVLHQRTATLMTAAASLTIEDRISCTGEHIVESYFHVHPDCQVTIEKRCIRIDNAVSTTTMQVDDRWRDIELLRASKDGRGGWYSRAFNALQETVTIRLVAAIHGTETFTTSIDCAGGRN